MSKSSLALKRLSVGLVALMILGVATVAVGSIARANAATNPATNGSIHLYVYDYFNRPVANAFVAVDSATVGKTSDTGELANLNATAGSHQLFLTAPGFKDKYETLTVNGNASHCTFMNDAARTVNLTCKKGGVLLKSSQFEVPVAGTPYGFKSSTTGVLTSTKFTPGTYTIAYRPLVKGKYGYDKYLTFTVPSGADLNVTLNW